MKRFRVRKKIKKLKNESEYNNAKVLYSILLGNSNKTADDVFLKNTTNENNKKIYLQTKILFNLREQTFKKLFNKGVIKNDSDESGIDDYEKNIEDRIKLSRQKLHEIKEKEQNINKELFKEYFHFQTPTAMLESLYDLNDKWDNDLLVRTSKSGLIN